MFKKIILVIVSIFVLLLIAAFVLPIIYKDKIIAMAKTEINNNVNAKVDFKSFDLTLISSFPDFNISLNKLSVVGINEFEGDTLTAIDELSATVDIMSVIKGDKISIEGISLEKPYFNLLVLKDGKANWDIAKPSTDTTTAAAEQSKFKIALKKYSIENGILNYDDESMGFKMSMENLNHSGKGDFTQDIFLLNTNTTADALNMWYGGVKYFNEIKTILKADLDMDMINSKYTFKENELSLNELVLGFDGFIAMPKDDIAMDLKFNARKNDFKNFISLIPGVYSKDFKDLKSSGKLEFNGFVKGIYNDTKMPGFGLNLKLQNGMFQYPSLPVAVNNVQMNLAINNADGVPDHTLIDLSKLHVDLGSEPFDARLKVSTPVSDANMDGAVKGKIDFANLGKIVPLEAGTSMSGVMNADVSFKGRMSAIEQKRYNDFNAAGNLSLTNFNYKSKDYPQGVDIRTCALTFNPSNVTLNSFDARMGKSDFKANGTIDNLLAYYFKNETLKGNFNLNSTLIDLNEFMGEETSTTQTTDTASLSLIEVPANIDFVLNAAINKLLYDNWTMEQVKGNITIRDQKISMNNLNLNTLGGNMNVTGAYAYTDKKNAQMNFAVNIKDFDMQQTAKTFNTIKKMAPIIENCTGKFNTDLTFITKLDQQMNPVLNTLGGEGKMTTANVVISNFKPLVKLAEELKMDQYKQVVLNNINVGFNFADGRVNIKPFESVNDGIKTKIKGSNGFDQTIDYIVNLEIPTSKLPSKATGTINGLLAQANAKGANMSLGDKINVDALIGGTVTNPVIKTTLKDTGKKMVDQAMDKAKEELEKQRKAAEEKAKAEFERLKKEGEDKAKSEADRLKKEAEAKAKVEADRLKKEAEQKAKDELKNLFKKK